MIEDRVSALELREAVSVEPDETIAETIALMRRHQTGCVVVRQQGALKGIFTERDILTGVLTEGVRLETPISTVMTAGPETLLLTDSVADVIRRMNDGGYRHMPVVEASGDVVGVVSVKCVVQYLVEHFPEAVYNLPPDPNALSTAREGG
ncbi:MAG: CBS domain-containing protein [Phycisphaerae bacterium]